MTKIAIIGLGHVGKGLRDRLDGVCDLVTYDIADGRDYPADDLATCDLGFICVGTPSAPDGSADVSHVIDAVNAAQFSPIVIKSTVPPGTTDRLIAETGKTICFSPEYTGESHWVGSTWQQFEDAAAFQIVGGEPAARRAVLDVLVSLFGPETQMFQCTAAEAEMVKYAENTYFATKVTFVNEIARLCAAAGLDWHTVREGWLLDPRVERDHTAVFPDAPGFAGRCLPKDLDALIAFAQNELGTTAGLLEAVRQRNETFIAGR
ncbi:MAG: UDPglucose 6-dehydrogenase [Nocardioidaceae bacterium]|nr:UDPglucose 6-dehydrogenase [Nocardioidaceae bacterium]